MTASKRFTAPVALAAALALPLLTNGCGDNPLDAACCTEFKVGADLSGADFGLEGEIAGKFKVFAQAAGDLAVVGQAALDDVTAACRAMAEDAGATKAEIDAEASKTQRDAVKGLCTLAIAKIDASFSAQGGIKGALKINVEAPQCSASVSASANCNANCSVDASCKGDVSAKPPTCEGGKLEVSCEGSCEAKAEAPSFSCEGTCEGSCSAEGGVSVNCEGQCDGTCEAGGSAGGTGVQADGSCNGTCKGTCAMKADAKVKCDGQCKGSCKASGGSASVKCDGECKGKAEPLSCKGGELKANVECKADANCSANCNASAQAKAECTPPRIDIQIAASAQGSLDAKMTASIETLKINLPKIFLVFKARGEAFANMVGTVAGSASAVFDPGQLGLKGAACIPAIVGALADASANMKVSLEASASVAGSVQ